MNIEIQKCPECENYNVYASVGNIDLSFTAEGMSEIMEELDDFLYSYLYKLDEEPCAK